LYPNPAQDWINLTISSARTDRISARIIDISGKVVKEQTINFTPGVPVKMDTRELSKGVYRLELKGETINEKKQFVKL
jgi:hypothetical protein